MIAVESVSKRFGDFTALDDVSFEAPDGKLTALLGPSGSGKSTLLRVIAGLEVPDSGTVVVSGTDATRLPPQKRGIGFVFQHYAAFKHMTLRDNVAFGLKIRKKPQGRDQGQGRRAAAPRRARRLRRPLPGAALRRPAPAHGARPRARGRAERAAARRAVRRARRQRPRATCARGCGACTSRSRSPPCSSRTTRRRRWSSPTGSCCSRTAGSPRSAPRASSTTQPADSFVMGFLGRVSKVDGELVRPHDVDALRPARGRLGGGDGPARRAPRLRGPRRGRAPRRRGGHGAAHARGGRGARARTPARSCGCARRPSGVSA